MPSALSKNKSLACISCTEQMDGIYSYTIRKDCDSCGGKSLAEYERISPLTPIQERERTRSALKNVRTMQKKIAE